MFGKFFKRRIETPNHDIPVYGESGMINLISYAHKSEPEGHRYRQFAIDDVPPWAVDIQLDTED